jgi:hypothetical protein
LGIAIPTFFLQTLFHRYFRDSAGENTTVTDDNIMQQMNNLEGDEDIDALVKEPQSKK